MACSSKGRFFSRGKSLEESVRGDIIDDILKGVEVIVRQDISLDSGQRLVVNTKSMEKQ